MLRASYSEGFRAPNIGELYNLGARFDSGISDPCNTQVNPVPPANCATLGVPDTTSRTTRRSPWIPAATASWSPRRRRRSRPGFTWDIPMGSGGIERMLLEAKLLRHHDRRCRAGAGRTGPAGRLHRDAGPAVLRPRPSHSVGTITSISGQLQNIGGIETDGVRPELHARTAESGFGSFKFQPDGVVPAELRRAVRGPYERRFQPRLARGPGTRLADCAASSRTR